MKTYINTITYILFLILLQYFFVSCERMIDVDLPNNQIPSEQVFEDVQTADAALAALYSGLWDNSPLAGDQTGKLLGTYTDDLSYYATTSTNGILDLYQNTHTDSNAAIYVYWASTYQKIYMANAIIEGVEQSHSLPTTDKNRLKGETLLIRSMLFYYLQQIYGDIPLPTTTDYNINKVLFKINSNEALSKIEADLNTVINLIPDDYRNAERIYPNKKVAQLMLAKIFMAQNKPTKWAEAETMLKNIIQSPLYTFQNDITKVFTKTGTHILWQLKPKNPGDAVKEASTYYFTGAAPSSFALSQDLVNAFSVNDTRKQSWMAPITVNGNTWYRAEKYKNRSNNTTEYSVVFRLEEVYLLLAESLTQQGKLVEALPYLNKTRQRAGLQPITDPVSKENLLTEILSENRREFFTEFGHRFFDLKRLNKLQTLQAIKPNWKEFHRIFPIPQKEILLNANLNPQNAGY
ncbi:RagB/SusD family nutrient uptake outer membrane protein [Elizabethkingia bruuniana]|uniref:RagB/SusD family nutrient uptake outer membrane protein n=2 Tax=Elizabethkingia TaxID=308865 RepID=A0A7T7ZY06_9FLAO|nr:RagB/SusD family nutrient uptake outer membrane protein [Elizabethkingia bruuniana]KGO10011.1 glycan metabolism protein RagB [Elizabethkingia miricola]MCT3940434.1 RagB/SusD family nutrient uptake outer membrane protein [Elizabethkingia anophelis]MCT4193650.1 RagB/SusD family nutrient uptake outer membrane protein [Elizabethkingia anophelis]MDV3662788.1 RagB/SusD family nutrient uptake outer membrane protein [Elizabethkingia anophelis]QDZ62238.1 RagB/SusD family nutrient uptake outer membra